MKIDLDKFISSLMKQEGEHHNSPINRSQIQQALIDQGIEIIDGNIKKVYNGPVPKFKFGDRIKKIDQEDDYFGSIVEEVDLENQCYTFVNCGRNIPFSIQDQFEIFEPLEKIEAGKWYMCINDYFAGGCKRALKGDIVQALEGMNMMGLGKEDAPRYFRLAKEEELIEYAKTTGVKSCYNCGYAICHPKCIYCWQHCDCNGDDPYEILEDEYLDVAKECPDEYEWKNGEYRGWLQFKWGDGKNAIGYVEPPKEKKSISDKENENLYEKDNLIDNPNEDLEDKFADQLDKETKKNMMERYGW